MTFTAYWKDMSLQRQRLFEAVSMASDVRGFWSSISSSAMRLEILSAHPPKAPIGGWLCFRYKQVWYIKISMHPISDFHCVTVLSRAWIWPLFWPFSGSSSIKQLDWLVQNFMISELNITYFAEKSNRKQQFANSSPVPSTKHESLETTRFQGFSLFCRKVIFTIYPKMLKKLWKDALCYWSTGRFFMPELPWKRDGQDIRNSLSRCSWWAKAWQATSSDGVGNSATFCSRVDPRSWRRVADRHAAGLSRRHQRAGKAAGSLSVGTRRFFAVLFFAVV